jgi:hypothetical protein
MVLSCSYRLFQRQSTSLIAGRETVHEAPFMPEICLMVNETSLNSFFDSKIPTPTQYTLEKIIPYALAIPLVDPGAEYNMRILIMTLNS